MPATCLIGGIEGQGFKQVMSALEVGRINVAARAVGVAQAAFESALDRFDERDFQMLSPTMWTAWGQVPQFSPYVSWVSVSATT